MNKMQAIERLLDSWDEWNHESVSDAPDKMREDWMDLVDEKKLLRFILNNATEEQLIEWQNKINVDMARMKRSCDTLESNE